MIPDPINPLWTVIGILFAPRLTLGILCIMMGHTGLGVFALIVMVLGGLSNAASRSSSD